MATTLEAGERELLLTVLSEVPQSIVWDINAIYFVYADAAIKVEASAETPDLQFPNDEVLCIHVVVIAPSPQFLRDGEPSHWYRVMGEHEPVQRIELLRTAVAIPGEQVVGLDDPSGTPVDVGVIIHTQLGVIPAVQMKNAFGFHNWPSAPSWVEAEHVEKRLSPKYLRIELGI